jgi:hypothetical protein
MPRHWDGGGHIPTGMQAHSSTSAKASQFGRSAITNGSRLLGGIDGRSALGRRYRDLQIALADDLGGPDKMTEAERALVRQAAALTVKSEEMQGAIIRGEAVDGEQLVRLTDAATRALTAVRRRTAGKARTGSKMTGVDVAGNSRAA